MAANEEGGAAEIDLDEHSDWTALTAVSRKIQVTFQRPPLGMPPPGWARKPFKRREARRLTAAQREWLDANFDEQRRTGERKRDKKIHKEMKEKFGMKTTADGSTLLCLKQSQIRSYISRKYAKLKREALDRSRRAAGEGSGSEDEEEEEDDDDEEEIDDDDDDSGGGGYEQFTIPELKGIIKKRKLNMQGKRSKKDLIDILESDDME